MRPSGASDFPTQSRQAKKHLEQCQVCQDKFKNGPDTLEQVQPTSPRRNLFRKLPLNTHLPQEPAANGTEHSSNVPHRLTLSVGGMTCVSCVIAITQALSGLPGVHDVSVSLLSSSATAVLDNKVIVVDVLEAFKNIGYEADVVSIRPLKLNATTIAMDGPLRVTFLVGGMTSTARSTITLLLSERDGVTDVSVDLIGNSASLVVESKELITGVQEVIESAGYEASAVSVEPVMVTSKAEDATQGQRTVALRIEGMFCE